MKAPLLRTEHAREHGTDKAEHQKHQPEISQGYLLYQALRWIPGA
jgi:hypothetical protein